MGAGNTGGRSTSAALFQVEPALEEAAPIVDALAAALGDVAELIALACVAPVVLAAERRQRTAQSRRSVTSSRKAA